MTTPWMDIIRGAWQRLPVGAVLPILTALPALAFLLPGWAGCGHPPGGVADAGLDAAPACPHYDAVIDSPVPVRIEGLEDVVDVAAGWEHHCAVSGSGEVYCWGSNCLGALGDGTTTDSATPVLVAGLPPAERVVVPRGGWWVSCALTVDKEVWCWGQGYEGFDKAPKHVYDLRSIMDIDIGAFHICALDVNGILQCWGSNSSGRLGIGEDAPLFFTSPVEPNGGHRFLSVYCSSFHTCAITTEGSFLCWGDTPETEYPGYRVVPEPVDNVPPITGFYPGFYHDCLIDMEANVWCWGYNDFGQVGSGETGLGELRTRFVQHPYVVDASQVAPGAFSTCALLQDGTVSCWGDDNHGQRGDGESNDELGNTPSQVVDLEDVVRISAGAFLVCAITADGALWCWGQG